MKMESGFEAYCLKCGNKTKDDETHCVKCGCRTLIIGEDGKEYVRGENGIECICGCEAFEFCMHINMSNTHKKVYKCKKCKKTISLDTEVDSYC